MNKKSPLNTSFFKILIDIIPKNAIIFNRNKIFGSEKMKSNFYAMMSRMKNIHRWGLMRNTRKENLSEHSLEVAQIAHALAIIGNKRFEKSYDINYVAAVAMYHDTSEIITGDMPTPIKYYNDEIKSAYKQIEAIAQMQLKTMLPDDFSDEFDKIYNPDKETKKLVKAADKISALIKCIEELNMGNREFSTAKDTIENAIKAMNVPEANVFLSEFLEGFELTLDELRKD